MLGLFLHKFIISDKKHEIKKMEGTEKLSKSQKNHLRKSKRCSQRPKFPDLPSFRLNTVVTGGSKHSLMNSIMIFTFSVTNMWFRFSALSEPLYVCIPSLGCEFPSWQKMLALKHFCRKSTSSILAATSLRTCQSCATMRLFGQGAWRCSPS